MLFVLNLYNNLRRDISYNISILYNIIKKYFYNNII